MISTVEWKLIDARISEAIEAKTAAQGRLMTEALKTTQRQTDLLEKLQAENHRLAGALRRVVQAVGAVQL